MSSKPDAIDIAGTVLALGMCAKCRLKTSLAIVMWLSVLLGSGCAQQAALHAQRQCLRYELPDGSIAFVQPADAQLPPALKSGDLTELRHGIGASDGSSVAFRFRQPEC